jgi:hypothetical protein
LIALVKDLTTLKASGYALEVTCQHLGLVAGAAILLVVLIRFAHKKRKVSIH